MTFQNSNEAETFRCLQTVCTSILITLSLSIPRDNYHRLQNSTITHFPTQFVFLDDHSKQRLFCHKYRKVNNLIETGPLYCAVEITFLHGGILYDIVLLLQVQDTWRVERNFRAAARIIRKWNFPLKFLRNLDFQNKEYYLEQNATYSIQIFTNDPCNPVIFLI